MLRLPRPLLAASILVCVAAPAAAEHAVTVLPEVVVEADRVERQSAVDAARTASQNTPGAVAVVSSEEFEDRYALNVRDILRDTPGVFVQQRFAEEARLSIRGSGLGRSNHLRGVQLLIDGVPINLPDGFGDFQELDPLNVRYAEVYKGGNGLRYGSSALGGAVNFVTPTGRSALQPNLLRLEGGSFETWRQHLALARANGRWDVYAGMTANQAEGYRDQSRTDNRRLNGNLGYRSGEGVETRFYLNINDIKQQIPGTLDFETALNDPQSTVPTAQTFDTGRDIDSVRVANKTALMLGGGRLEVGGYYFHKRLYHPVTGVVVDQDGDFHGVFAHWLRALQIADLRNELTLGLRAAAGDNHAKLFANEGGRRGDLLADADESASELNLYAENRLWLSTSLALITALQGVQAGRDYRDRRNAAESADQTFEGINPKLGVLWQLEVATQVFGNISRSYEPPIFADLNQNSAVGVCAGTDAGGFADLDAQKAWTAELGTRGERGRWRWDVALYRAEIRDEVLQRACSATMAIQFNAEDTVHQGVEAGLVVTVASGLIAAGDALSLHQAYTYADFRFDGDETFGNNTLAGQPRHHYQLSLRYTHASGFFIEPGLERAVSAAYADYANTFESPAYTVWGLSAGVDLPRGTRLFLEARNLSDERYISSVSATTDYSTAGNHNLFFPGEGRAVFGGLRWAFDR